MKYVQILPAVDWFVVSHRQNAEWTPLAVTRIVAWGLDADGEVSGIVPSCTYDSKDGAVLVGMEEGRTKYKHFTMLSKLELEFVER